MGTTEQKKLACISLLVACRAAGGCYVARSILFFPGSVGSACFADEGDEDSVAQASGLSRQAPAKLAEIVLDSCGRQIDLARQLGFLPYADLRGIDFHALPAISRR